VVVFAIFQIVVKKWSYIGFENDGIPKTHAFSQSTWITTQQYSTTKRENGSRDVWRKQKDCFVLSRKRSLVRLYDTGTSASIANTNSTEGAMKTANTRRSNSQVRSIMSILEERYDLPLLSTDGTIDQKRKTKEWKKTRNYLYHATRSQHDKNGDHVFVVNAFEAQAVSVLDFLDERLELPPEVSKKILQQSPRILRKPVDSFLIPTSEFLLRLWGRDLFVQAVQRNPALLLSSGVGYTTNRKNTNGTFVDTSADDRSVEEIISSRTELSSKAMKRMKGTAPFVFGLEASKVVSVLDFLDGILRQREEDTAIAATGKDTAKRMKILGKVILAHPHLLNLSVESNLKPRVEFLAKTCDLTPTQVAKVVQTSNGSVLGLSVEENLKPTMDFILQEIFRDNNDNDPSDDDPRTMLKKCVLTHPQLLGLSLSNLQSKVAYFHSIGPLLAVRIARKCPSIYSLNLDQNIIPTFEFLAGVWGMKFETKASKKKNKNDDFLAMLHEYPNIVTLSVESNLQPTMMFFNKTGYTLLNENWELIPSKMSSPTRIGKKGPQSIRGRYIAASLYNRLLPRWHYCLSKINAEAKNPDGSKTSERSSVSSSPQPGTPPLHLLVMASDDAFCKAMNFEPESFAKFKKEAIPRLKFSCQFDTWLKTGKPIDL
jgi:hypothetical protein